MAAKEIRVAFDERCRLIILFRAKECSGANERGNDGGKSGWRIAAGFLPAFFAGDGPLMQQEACRPLDHDEWIEFGQKAKLLETPCQKHGECNFVELHRVAKGIAVDPEVLEKAAVLFLSGRQ